MRSRSEAQAAARRPGEAGLRGVIDEQRSIGYTLFKKVGPGRSAACVVRLYPMEAASG